MGDAGVEMTPQTATVGLKSRNGVSDVENGQGDSDASTTKPASSPTTTTKPTSCEPQNIPWCWYADCSGTGSESSTSCVCHQGTGVSCCCVCGWTGIGGLLFLFLLLISAYWSCWSVEEYRLAELSSVSDGSFVPVHSDPSQPNAARERAAAGNVSVLNYNVFLRPQLVTDSATSAENDFKTERMEYMTEASFLDAYDVLLLQETWMVLSERRKETFVEAATAAGFPYFSRGACRGEPITSMLLLMSRHPLVTTAEFTFTQRGGEALASKGVLHGRVWVNGNSSQPIDFFTTHLLSGLGSSNDDVRSVQIQEIVAFVQERRALAVGDDAVAGDNAIVIAGDFNIDGRLDGGGDGAPGPLHDRLLSDLQPLNSTGSLQDLVMSNIPSNKLPVTYPVSSAGSALLAFDPYDGESLDYAFFEKGSGPIQVVPGTARVDHMTVTGRPYVTLSDHFAIPFMLQTV